MIIDSEQAKTFIMEVDYVAKTVTYGDGRTEPFTEADEPGIHQKILEQVLAIEAEAD